MARAWDWITDIDHEWRGSALAVLVGFGLSGVTVLALTVLTAWLSGTVCQ